MKGSKITAKSILTSILSDNIEHATIRLKKVQQIMDENFLLPEIDGPRMEICSCYIAGCYTACITLTNHLLERYCKELLITVEFGNSFLRFNHVVDGTPPDLARYLSKDLSATLSACKTKRLLSKQDWKKLDDYKNIFRNGFAHYDPAKILQGRAYSISTLSIDGKTSEPKEIRFQDTPLAGLAIDAFAETNAWLYLVTVENGCIPKSVSG